MTNNDRFLWNEDDIQITKEGSTADDLYVPAEPAARHVPLPEED